MHIKAYEKLQVVMILIHMFVAAIDTYTYHFHSHIQDIRDAANDTTLPSPFAQESICWVKVYSLDFLLISL